MKNLSIKPSTLLTVIAVCSGSVFVLAIPDLIRAIGTDAFDYIFAVECLTLCLMAITSYLYFQSVKEEDNDKSN